MVPRNSGIKRVNFRLVPSESEFDYHEWRKSANSTSNYEILVHCESYIWTCTNLFGQRFMFHRRLI